MSSSAIRALLSNARSRYLLLDSNLLTLWITAQYDLRLLSTFKRVQMFSQQDAVLLGWLVQQHRALVITSQTATETSNLGNSLSSGSRIGWFSILAQLCSTTLEQTPALKHLAGLSEFQRFGVTDCALFTLADEFQVLTTDYPLSTHYSRKANQIFNFNDLRNMA